MNTEDNRFWLGIGLAILGLIPPAVEFAKKDIQFAVLYSAVFVLMLAWFFVSLRSGRGPHYETVLMRKMLTLRNREGKLAEVRREQTVRARYGNLEGIWWRGNIVDGTMSNFKVDGDDPDVIEPLGCSRSFYKRFTNPLSKGGKKTVIWSFNAVDSFLSSEESFLHETIPGMKELRLEVNFPDDRRCIAEEFHVEVAGDDTRTLSGLQKVNGGKQLIAVVKSPKPGRTYRLDWKW